MKCTFCGAIFSIHEKTYQPIMMPDFLQHFFFKQNFRTAFPVKREDLCASCCERLREAVRDCKTRPYPPPDEMIRESTPQSVAASTQAKEVLRNDEMLEESTPSVQEQKESKEE